MSVFNGSTCSRRLELVGSTIKDRLPGLLRAFLAPAAFVAGSLLATDTARAASIGSVFYIEMENHNFTQPSSDTTPQQIPDRHGFLGAGSTMLT